MLVDEDLDEPPGLEPVPEDEVENAKVPNLEVHAAWAKDGQSDPMIWA